MATIWYNNTFICVTKGKYIKQDLTDLLMKGYFRSGLSIDLEEMPSRVNESGWIYRDSNEKNLYTIIIITV